MVPRIGHLGLVIEIEDRDWVKSILTLDNPEEYELPSEDGPGGNRQSGDRG
jgi:hypothetical protein